MSIVAEKIATDALELPAAERALVARRLISSLDPEFDADAETQWLEVIDRRSREIAAGTVDCRPVAEAVRNLRAKLNASRHQPS